MPLRVTVLCLFSVLAVGFAKVYERCELAKELKTVHNTPEHQLATWVCIAEHESQYDTSAVGRLNGDGSKDHGIFQISDLYWCSPPGKGWACGVTCAQLKDDDITDDYACARRIYKEHKGLSGDGFNAWAVYRKYCDGNRAEKYIQGCFSRKAKTKMSTSNNSSASRNRNKRLITKNIFGKISYLGF